MTHNGDATEETLNLPHTSHMPIPESSDPEVQENETKPEDKAPSEFVSSLNNMVRKELRDLTKSLPDGNLGNFKLLDGDGAIIDSDALSLSHRPHKKRGLPLTKTPKPKNKKPRTPGTPRKRWEERAACVFAYLHPRIGHKNYHLTSELCRISANTLRGWMSKGFLMAKWVPIVESMTAKDVGKILNLNLENMGVDANDMVETAEFRADLIQKNLTPVLIKQGKKRIQSRPRMSKWNQQFIFLQKLLDTAWENGKPITLKLLRELLFKEFQQPEGEVKLPQITQSEDVSDKKKDKQQSQLKMFSKRYLANDGKNFPTLINTFVQRGINRSGYTFQDSVLKKIQPLDWRSELDDFKKSFNSLCSSKSIDSVLVIDAMFLTTLAEDDVMRADLIPDVEPTPGLIVLVGATVPANRLLKPIIIGKKTPEVTKEKVYSEKSEVVLTSDGHVNLLALKAALVTFSKELEGKKVALLVDETSLHKSVEFRDIVDEVNASVESATNFEVLLIPNALSRSFNVVETLLKEDITNAMNAKLQSNSIERSSRFDSVVEKLKDGISLIESCWEEVNKSSSKLIEDSFIKCGQVPLELDATSQSAKDLVFDEYIALVQEVEDKLANVQKKLMFDVSPSPQAQDEAVVQNKEELKLNLP